MLSLWSSTAELESSFSTLRLFSSGIKSNMTAIHQDEYVKVYADAPAADAFAKVTKLGGMTCYEPSSLCLAVQKKYRELYGGCGSNGRQHTLPRRCVKSRKRATGLKAYERRRLEQQSLIKADPSTPDSASSKTEEAAIAEEARKGDKSKHVKLLDTLKKQMAERKLAFEMGPCQNIESKLAEKEREVLNRAEILANLEEREQSKQVRELDGRVTAVLLGGDMHYKTRLKKSLARTGICSVYGAADFLNGIWTQTLFSEFPLQILWLCCDSDYLKAG